MIPATRASAARSRGQSILFSPVGVGKTSMAASASADIPDWFTNIIQAPPKGVELALLRDIGWIGYDRDALAGFERMRIDVEHYYDLSGVAPNVVLKESLEVLEDIRKKGLPNLVVDTLSAFNNALALFHAPKEAVDKRAYYAAILADNMKFYGALRLVDAEIQLLCHIKEAYQDDNSKLRRSTLGVPDFSAAITGQAGDKYKGDSNNVLMLKRVQFVGEDKKPRQKVVAMTQPLNGIDCKVRGGSDLPSEVDADWRVIRRLLAG